jgi:hypothetical protein
MDSARPSDSSKLLSLQDAAQKLAVDSSVLLKWNDQNILKPTITFEGKIGYTEKQLEEFQTIRQLFQQKTNLTQTTSNQTFPSPTAPLNSNQPDSTSTLPVQAPSETSKKPFKFPVSKLVSVSAVVVLAILFIILEKPLASNSQNQASTTGAGQANIKTSSLNVSEPVKSNISLASENSAQENKNIDDENTSKKTTFSDVLSAAKTEKFSSQAASLTRANTARIAAENATLSAKTTAINNPETNKNITSYASTSNPNNETNNSQTPQSKGSEELAYSAGSTSILSQNSYNFSNSNSNNQLILFIATIVAIPFIFQKKLLYPFKKPAAASSQNLDILPQI